MNYSKAKNIKFNNPGDFDFMIQYAETDKRSHVYEIELHTHEELEIYINLTGDVSFLVENNLYPLGRGDIIVARPGEHHHCVYRSEALHKHFWILLRYEKDKELFEFLKDLDVNFISPPGKVKNEIIDLCYSMLNEDLQKLDKFYCFLRLMKILKMSKKDNIEVNYLPEEFTKVLEYIDEHITENLKVTDIANTFFLSESTIERRFREYLEIKPLEFIRKKKMILAAELLRKGQTVLNAGMSVGYGDSSHFIKLFKRYYGMTPMKYKSIRNK